VRLADEGQVNAGINPGGNAWLTRMRSNAAMNEAPFAPFRVETNGLAEMPAFPDTPLERARCGAVALRQTAALARTLAASGRPIDLTGLDGQVGLICARALDLPAEQGLEMRGDLEELLAEIDSLAAAMRLSPVPS